MAYDFIPWPSCRYGPNGESAIFNSEDEVPKGWLDHPAKFADKVEEPVEDKPRRGRPPKAAVEESEF